MTFSPTEPEDFFALAPVLGEERSILVQKKVWTAREVIDPATLEPTLIFFGTGFARRVRQ